MFMDIRYVHTYTVCARIYGVLTDIRCDRGYTVCSRIYGVVTDIRVVH